MRAVRWRAALLAACAVVALAAPAATAGADGPRLARPVPLPSPAGSGCSALEAVATGGGTVVALGCQDQVVRTAVTRDGGAWATRAVPGVRGVVEDLAVDGGDLHLLVRRRHDDRLVLLRTTGGRWRPVQPLGSSRCVHEAELAAAGGRWWAVWRQSDTRPGTAFCTGRPYLVESRTTGSAASARRLPADVDGHQLDLVAAPSERGGVLLAYTTSPAAPAAPDLYLAANDGQGWSTRNLTGNLPAPLSVLPGQECEPETPCPHDDDPPAEFGRPQIAVDGRVVHLVYLDGGPVLLTSTGAGGRFRRSSVPTTYDATGTPRVAAARGRLFVAFNEEHSDLSERDGWHARLAQRRADGTWAVADASWQPQDPGVDDLQTLTAAGGRALVVARGSRLYSRTQQ